MDNQLAEAPFFSIVIPVYNRYELVNETIRSVLSQETRNFEIIIVDDGSTDGSGKMLDDAYGNIPEIRIYHQLNLERGASRNRGFEESKGDYIVFLDSDDRLLPDHLAVLFNKIKSLGYPDFIATKFEFLKDHKRSSSDISGLKEGYYDYRLFLNGNPLACNVCIKKNNAALFLFVQDRQYAIKEDWMFFIQNLRHQVLYLVDQVTILMLDHPNRSMLDDHGLLIMKTQSAKEWIIENVELNAGEVQKLEAHVSYFCAIHSYIDFERKNALRFILNAFYLGGLKGKYVLLFIKILAGKKLISRLK